jgi:hypothetical protein
VIQFGYISMFVSTFFYAALFCYINNIIEVRIDAYKMLTYRKARCYKDNGIGVWLDMMKLMSIFAVIVNCALLWRFAEDWDSGVAGTLPNFIVDLFAQLRTCGETIVDFGSNASTLEVGTPDTPDSPPACDYEALALGYKTVVAVIVLEHLVLFGKICLSGLLSGEPSSIADTNFREEYWAKKHVQNYYDRLSREKERYSVTKDAAVEEDYVHAPEAADNDYEDDQSDDDEEYYSDDEDEHGAFKERLSALSEAGSNVHLNLQKPDGGVYAQFNRRMESADGDGDGGDNEAFAYIPEPSAADDEDDESSDSSDNDDGFTPIEGELEKLGGGKSSRRGAVYQKRRFWTVSNGLQYLLRPI